MSLAPIEELLYRPRIRHPGTIPDGRGKKLDEALGRALAVRRIAVGSASIPARTSVGVGAISLLRIVLGFIK